MSAHSSITRSCQRKSYARLYLVIRPDAPPPIALCDARDGLLLAFTDWEKALKASVKFGGLVTNLDEFRRRGVLDKMDPRPTAMRILMTDRKSVARSFYAAFDATPEELRTLNQIEAPSVAARTPLKMQAARAKAKVWEEKPAA